jgi:hypothetical protein
VFTRSAYSLVIISEEHLLVGTLVYWTKIFGYWISTKNLYAQHMSFINFCFGYEFRPCPTPFYGKKSNKMKIYKSKTLIQRPKSNIQWVNQGCEWNERSLNRGPESRPRLGSNATFFWDSCSNLDIDKNVRISHNLGLGLAAKISQAFAIQLVRYRDQYTPRPNSPPPQNLRNCEILGP